MDEPTPVIVHMNPDDDRDAITDQAAFEAWCGPRVPLPDPLDCVSFWFHDEPPGNSPSGR